MVACGRDVSKGDTSAVRVIDSRSAAAPAGKGACPATGKWAVCQVMARLDQAEDTAPGAGGSVSSIPDDRLQLMFTCCHPALAPDAQVALTLRTLGGLTTEEIQAAIRRDLATSQSDLAKWWRKMEVSQAKKP